LPILGSPDADTHRDARRTLQPAFARERIAEAGDTVAALAEAAVADWGETVDVGAASVALTAAIGAATLFPGAPLDPALAAARVETVLTGFRPFTTLGATLGGVRQAAAERPRRRRARRARPRCPRGRAGR
jgi:cytochrome P450